MAASPAQAKRNAMCAGRLTLTWPKEFARALQSKLITISPNASTAILAHTGIRL